MLARLAIPRSRWLIVVCLAVFSFLFLASQEPAHDDWHARDFTARSRPDDSIRNILNETLGFEEIFVVSLASRTDRRDAMSLAAHLTGLKIEYVDGVTEVNYKALPAHDEELELSAAYLGSWRAHMNALRRMIDGNITSALILEDDADWDVRIKSQMQTFARASQTLTQARFANGPDQRWDTTQISPSDLRTARTPNSTHATTDHLTSPYGNVDAWDVLWLGHCGTRFAQTTSDPGMPTGKVVLENDETVPETQHISIEFIDQGELLRRRYRNHTRVVHRAAQNACSAAYAVSLPGARRLLYEMSSRITDVYDLMLGEICGGTNGRRMGSCLTVQPQLFNQHQGAGVGAGSDISPDEMGAVRQTAFTRNVRWSTRVNMRKLVEGETDFVDSWPDGTPRSNFVDS